jgi:hypothetical protein
MTRNEALEIARTNFKANTIARIDFTFGRTANYDEAAYGYRHGWYAVGDFSFDVDEITGIPYDHTQGGWAFI